jgi:uncharacterized protein DUF669
MQDFLDEPFDTENEEASQPFALIPSGRYKAEIVKAMCGPTKNGKGYSVSLNWSIVEGEHENRTIFQNILIQHESTDAQKFGRQKFKDVLVALGIKSEVTDLSVMPNKPCLIGVAIRKDKSEQYPDRNEVGRVLPLPAHNGPTRDAIREAQKTPEAFKPVHAAMNDKIPF